MAASARRYKSYASRLSGRFVLIRSSSASKSAGAIAPTTRAGDLILQLEHVLEVAVVPVGPEMGIGRGIDELPGDAQPTAGAAHAPFEDVADSELPPDLADVHRPVLVGEGRVAGDNEELRKARQRGDNVLDDPVGKVLLIGIGAHVGEDRDRGFVRQSRLGVRLFGRRGGRRHMIEQRPQGELRVALDDRQRLLGEEPDEQLVDGRLAELCLEGELFPRHALAREIVPDRCRDLLPGIQAARAS